MFSLIVIVIALSFILLDFLTGIIKALKNKEFTSTKMREGLYHKIGFILTVGFGYLVDFAQGYVDIGVTLPIKEVFSIYIIVAEIGSIIENLGEINPNILPQTITSYFKKLNERK